MRRLHLKVRGNKDQDPLVRRIREEDHSVIAQEGAVLVESESLARQVAYLAKDCGARTVMVGDCEISEDPRGRKMSQSEMEVVNRFNKAFKQRGRPSEGDREIRSWVVSCPECVNTSTLESDRLVIQCPKCGGLRAASRVGYRHIFSKYPENIDEWKDMHFCEGYFETPEFRVGEVGEAIKHVELDGDNLSVYEGLLSSKMVNDYLVGRLQFMEYRQLLADIFIARRYYTKKDRQRPRTSVVVDLLQKGVSPTYASLMEGDFDVLDASIIENDKTLITNFYISLQGEK